MRFNLQFAPSSGDPLSTVPFEEFKSEIRRADGSEVFAMAVTAPAHFSQTAVDMLAQKYARKAGVPSATVPVAEPGVPDWLSPRAAADGATFGAETDARQIFHRLAGCWTYWGWKEGYFDSEEDARRFYADAVHALAAQRFAPNSPQWFNTGLAWAYGIGSDDRGQWAFSGGSRDVPVELVTDINQYERPASGACFIQRVEDNLVARDGILEMMAKEARVFRNGAGSGANYSRVRGTGEPLSGGGKSSGLPSFLEPIDRNAGAIKSGGTVRRAARMVVLDVDHPDIEWFIDWKASEEKKVAALAVGSRILKRCVQACYEAAAAGDDNRLSAAAADARGLGVPAGTIDGAVRAAKQGIPCPEIPHFDAAYEGAGYQAASGQNANNSVRVTDAFMRAVAEDKPWHLYWRTELTKAAAEGRAPAPCKTIPARALWRKICYAAWDCADPGIQFDTTVNDGNTVANDGRINGTNPCCLVGATPVFTAEGLIRIDDLAARYAAGEPLPKVRAWDPVGKTFVEARILRAWRSGHTSDLLRVTTTAGCEIICTPNHRFMLDAGGYVEACELRPDQPLKTYSPAAPDAVGSTGTLSTTAVVGVYDLEVEGVHNFAVGDAYYKDRPPVIVHNSEYNFLDDTTCVAPESRISTPHGLRTVEDLYAAQLRGEPVLITTDIHGENDHRQLTAHRPAAITRVGEREVFRVTLADGRSVRATAEHKFLTDTDGWRRVDELITGTHRLRLREGGDPVTFSSTKEDVDRWQLLGWLTGDGVFSEGNVALVFGPDEAATAAVLCVRFNDLLTEAVHHYEGRAPSRLCNVGTQPNGVLQITSKCQSLVRYLEEHYGMKQGTAVQKDVPTRLHHVPPDLKIAYLQGLFSADGSIRQPVPGVSREIGIDLASSAPELVRSVQLVLADLGVTSRATWHHPTGRKNPQAQLHIYNRQARKFAVLIGMPLSGHKNTKLQEVVTAPFSGVEKNPRPARVVAIESCGPTLVYDVTEPVTRSFVVEGIISHNCNLASVNVAAFYDGEDDKFDATGYQALCRLVTTVLDITVTMSSYPTRQIADNAAKYRTLGLGPMNVGALLMRVGVPYDSDAGRGWAASVVGLMHLTAMRTSAEIAATLGTFPRWAANAEHTRRVTENHLRYILGEPLDVAGVQPPPCAQWLDAAREAPNLRAAAVATRKYMNKHGWKLRNAQLSLAAPTGTIGLVTDCDTTGAEPDFALTKYKKLAGGGHVKLVNKSIGPALRRLGYSALDAEKVCAHVRNADTIEGARELKKEHLPVFDCANRCGKTGKRFIAPMGHVRMLAALTPLVSGSLSKTVNLPPEATYDDVEEIYREAHRLGVKCVAVYRDGSKLSQPLTSGLAFSDAGAAGPLQTAPPVLLPPEEPPQPVRLKLPNRRTGHTQKVRIGAHKFYIRTGEYEDGRLGEIFIDVDKEGSMLRGVTNTLAKVLSIAVQCRVPVEELVDAMRGTKFEPNGPVGGHDRVKMCTSFVDMIARHLQIFYMRDESAAHVPGPALSAPSPAAPADERAVEARLRGFKPAPCSYCGHWELAPTAKCHTCQNCGMSDGCS